MALLQPETEAKFILTALLCKLACPSVRNRFAGKGIILALVSQVTQQNKKLALRAEDIVRVLHGLSTCPL